MKIMARGQGKFFPCDLCSSWGCTYLPQSEKYGSGGVFICNGCGFIYVPQRRPLPEILADWDKIYADGTYSADWPAVKARLQYVAEYYQGQHGWEGKNVLEIGAGQGRFLNIVRGMGAHPVAIEPSLKNCQDMRRNEIFAHHGDAEKCGTVGTFDVVAILWTLENCTDCNAMLNVAYDNLRAGGHLIVATGSRILVPFKKRLSMYFSNTPADTHCFRFSDVSLSHAMRLASFRPPRFNDFENLDWLVGISSRSYRYGLDVARPIPGAIQSYFDEWEKMFP